MKLKSLSLVSAAAVLISSCVQTASDDYLIDQLGIRVSVAENREYSFTDKQAGYWYGTTHQDRPEFWSGWNMAKKRILADYTLGIDESVLDRKSAECTVYPDRI